MIKYLLVMQFLFDGYKAGGASIETVFFDSQEQCQLVKNVFLEGMNEKRPHHATIYRQAKCVEVTK